MLEVAVRKLCWEGFPLGSYRGFKVVRVPETYVVIAQEPGWEANDKRTLDKDSVNKTIAKLGSSQLHYKIVAI